MAVGRRLVAISVAAISWLLAGQYVSCDGESTHPIVSIQALVDSSLFPTFADNTTIGLTPKCTFPFYWNRVRYHTCTTADRELPWCALEISNRTWEPIISVYCNLIWERDPYPTLMSPTVPPGGGRSDPLKDCLFPFVWKNITYNNCTTVDAKKPWCPIKISDNVTREPVASAYCKEMITGDAPYEPAPTVPAVTVNGSLCVFPFVYKGVAYHRCTKVDADAPWCPINVTAQGLPLLSDYCKYEIENLTSISRVGPPSFLAKTVPSCTFPFMWGGDDYYECTTTDRELPWCAIDLTFSRRPLTSMYCNYSWESDPYPTLMSPTLPMNTFIRTIAMKDCSFPFKWKGKIYDNCTMADALQPWCPLEVNPNWMYPTSSAYCEELSSNYAPPVLPPPVISEVTVRGLPCMLPFLYKGVAYHTCTSVDAFDFWCPSKVTVEGFPIRTDYCSIIRKGKPVKRRLPKTPAPTYFGGKVRMKCVVPFIYKGKKYQGCTRNHSSFPWCAGNVDLNNEVLSIIPCSIDDTVTSRKTEG